MLSELFLLPIFFTAIQTSRQIQLVEKNTSDIEISKCVEAISKRYFLQLQNVEIISKVYLHGFEDFGIVMRSTPEFGYPDLRKSLTKYAVIFLESVNYERDSEMLKTLSRFDPQGRFIVIIDNRIDPLKNGKEYVERIIYYLADIERWNVVILMNDNTRNKLIRVYTYTMYSSRNCTRIPKLLEHGNCQNAVILNDLFPSVVNFHKCPIHLCTVEFPPFSIIHDKHGNKNIRGIESNLVKLIVEKLNATYEVFQVSSGTTVREMVKTRKADIAWSCLLQSENVGSTWSQSYLMNKVLIVIPQSRLMPFWMNLILPFQVEIWQALTTLISINLFIKLLIPSIRRQFHLEWMLSGFFGIGISRLPMRVSHRIYLLSWILIGYVIMQSYSASLTGFFASPGQYKQMQTLGELDKTKIVTGGLQNLKSQLAQTNPRLSRDLKVFSEVEYFENIAKLIAKEEGGIASYIQADQVLNITYGQESDFVVIPEHFNSYPLALLMPNFSVILEESNRVILHLCKAGLIDFWRQSFHREMYSGFKLHHEDTEVKTSLAHLGAAFFVLVVGYCLSSVLFIVELFYSKFGI